MPDENKPNKGDGGAAQVQAAADEDNAKGYHGTEVDPTPDSAYTVAGVTSGAKTPTPREAIDIATEAGKTRADRERKE